MRIQSMLDSLKSIGKVLIQIFVLSSKINKSEIMVSLYFFACVTCVSSIMLCMRFDRISVSAIVTFRKNRLEFLKLINAVCITCISQNRYNMDFSRNSLDSVLLHDKF